MRVRSCRLAKVANSHALSSHILMMILTSKMTVIMAMIMMKMVIMMEMIILEKMQVHNRGAFGRGRVATNDNDDDYNYDHDHDIYDEKYQSL